MTLPEPRRGWNDTAAYFDVLLDAVPPGARRALEIGCGEGDFARRLAARVGHVDAIDVDAGVIARAKALSEGVANLSFRDVRARAPDDRRPRRADPPAAEIRREAARLLPGAQIRPYIFWRNTLLRKKTGDEKTGDGENGGRCFLVS